MTRTKTSHCVCADRLQEWPSQSLAQSKPIVQEASTVRVVPPTLKSRIGRPRTTSWQVSFITPHQPSTSSKRAPCVDLWLLRFVVLGCPQRVWSVMRTKRGRHVQHEDDLCWDTRNLASNQSSSRMASQPRSMSDQCSPHQSVIKLPTEELNRNFSSNFSVPPSTNPPQITNIFYAEYVTAGALSTKIPCNVGPFCVLAIFVLRESTLFPELTVRRELANVASEEIVASLEVRASPGF